MPRSKNRKEPGPLEKAFDDGLTAVARQDARMLQIVLAREPRVVQCRDPEERTLLLNACLPVAQRASVTIVEVLLKAGSDPAARDYQGLSGLHGLVQIERASPNQPVAEVAKLLVGAGLPVDALDNYGDTPLWRAIMAYQPGSFGTIDVLLSMGADPSIPNKKGVTAHWLAMKLDGREELRQHLRVKWPNVFG